MNKIEISWYLNDDVTYIARKLLGATLCTHINGELTTAKIVESEAYSGNNDRACHANGQRMTKRNKVMFGPGGYAYVYLCYGIHHLFNIVTNKKGSADAVLIRAVEPIYGIEVMMRRRNLKFPEKKLSGGPGVLSKALGIQLDHYGLELDSDTIWVEVGDKLRNDQIISTTRIGVEYAKEDALKPWRFYMKENEWVSRF